MKRWFSPAGFSTGFCAGYVVLFVANVTPFRYYPVTHQWALGSADAVKHVGPAVVWYGLVTGAVLVGLAGALILRDRWTMRSVSGALWLVPLLAMLACVILLRSFFL